MPRYTITGPLGSADRNLTRGSRLTGQIGALHRIHSEALGFKRVRLVNG